MMRNLFLSVLLLAVSGVVFSAETPKTTIDGVSIIDAKKAKELQSAGALIVDARPKMEYLDGHIPGNFNQQLHTVNGGSAFR